MVYVWVLTSYSNKVPKTSPFYGRPNFALNSVVTRTRILGIQFRAGTPKKALRGALRKYLCVPVLREGPAPVGGEWLGSP
ncbi:hypothetical protein B9Q08_00930 [Candidatus Marsarchaeota G2 archaeon ECH_B_SAG-M15]|uniref:Uncharacterized protein n=1 Tax=Candidatus Marsarchaeota G2 archaeon ECH_B_SAG-M15 TaxID=1978162 RepID=A0A2R6B292_9ARCH|nr:MAG: hypothetical protein B9Q08_00930 [Candidatus Marsarchaeota G2 archaeon ECH_B_SAG-M15]